jgi:hypothetical protein
MSWIQICGKLQDLVQPPRFAKYRPAPRLGTRRVERRLLRRVGSHIGSGKFLGIRRHEV